MKWFLLSSMIVVSGCAGYTAEGIDRVKEFADNAAIVVLADTCAMALGGYFRLENPNHKLGSALLCDPNASPPITVEDVLRLMGTPNVIVPKG